MSIQHSLRIDEVALSHGCASRPVSLNADAEQKTSLRIAFFTLFSTGLLPGYD